MLIGIPKERLKNELRVAATPNTVEKLIKLGFKVIIERNAGSSAYYNDNSYLAAGAKIGSTQEAWKTDIVLKINAPVDNEIELMQASSTLISFIWPAQNLRLLEKLAKKNITLLAMDNVPRISRAQYLDALSSMANIAGYRAIVEAAYAFGRFFSGQITAAGKIMPAKVMVIGAGVAGLAAIGTAKSLGAIVFAFDTRPEVKEQVQSMGGKFLEVDIKEEIDGEVKDDGYTKVMSKAFIEAEMALFAKQAKEVDIIITTAFVPSQAAPTLITKEMVESMKPGSVIVDLAAQNGGNCELTVPDRLIITENEVKIIGYTDLPSRLSTQSSQLYSNNIVNLMKLLCKQKNGQITIDFNDIIIRSFTVIRAGKITWPAPSIQTYLTPKAVSVIQTTVQVKKTTFSKNYLLFTLFIILLTYIGNVAPSIFLSHFTIFILACIVGYYVVWNVSYALHTPLMSVTNAISGIIVVGAVLQMKYGGWVSFIAFIAILIASINIFGGFTVTQRMLKMFRKG